MNSTPLVIRYTILSNKRGAVHFLHSRRQNHSFCIQSMPKEDENDEFQAFRALRIHSNPIVVNRFSMMLQRTRLTPGTGWFFHFCNNFTSTTLPPAKLRAVYRTGRTACPDQSVSRMPFDRNENGCGEGQREQRDQAPDSAAVLPRRTSDGRTNVSPTGR